MAVAVRIRRRRHRGIKGLARVVRLTGTVGELRLRRHRQRRLLRVGARPSAHAAAPVQVRLRMRVGVAVRGRRSSGSR